MVVCSVPLVWRISEAAEAAAEGRPPPQLAEQFGTAQTPDEDEPQPAADVVVPLLGVTSG